MLETFEDKLGRMYCKMHRRQNCHECCVDFRSMNEMMEVDAGVRKAPSRMEELAKERAELVRGMYFMKEQQGGRVPPVMRENYAFHEEELKRVDKDIAQLRKNDGIKPEEVAAAQQNATQTFAKDDADMSSIFQAWKRENPTESVMSYGGSDTQRLHDSVVSVPHPRLTCSYCQKKSSTGFQKCSICQIVYYLLI